MTPTPEGRYEVIADQCPPVRMTTSKIGFTSFDIEAPVRAGELDVGAESSSLRVELALDRLRTNPLMQAAARALVASGGGQTLVFTAAGPGAAEALVFSGDAQAGDVVVPMTLEASVRDGGDGVHHVDLSGTAEFHDVHIPLPGMGGVRTITTALEATLVVSGA